MNTGELMQVVHDSGCEFDCNVVGDLYRYLRRRDEIWIMLPKAFAWIEDDPSSPNNARLVMNFNHAHSKTDDRWRLGSIYSKLDIVYDDPEPDQRIPEQVPIGLELVEGISPMKEREMLTHPGIITTFLSELVDDARAKTKEIRAAQVRIAAKEYEL